MSTWNDLERLGYATPEASPGIRFISGFGVSSYVADDDQLTIEALADPSAHDERVLQFVNGPPVTIGEPAASTLINEKLMSLNPKTATVEQLIAALQAATG